MRFAYADPPYLGRCADYDHAHHGGGCWDNPETHRDLLLRLSREFPEGWALSLHVPSLRFYQNQCAEIFGENVVRVGGWFKPFAAYKVGVNPAYCWEPVLFFGGRSAVERGGRSVPTVRDFIEAVECDAPAVKANITMKKGVKGAKPDAFSFWLFEFLGANGNDDFHDLFHGSGSVARAWKEYAWANPARGAA